MNNVQLVTFCFLLVKNAAEIVLMFKTAYKDDHLRKLKCTSGLLVLKMMTLITNLVVDVHQLHEATKIVEWLIDQLSKSSATRFSVFQRRFENKKGSYQVCSLNSKWQSKRTSSWNMWCFETTVKAHYWWWVLVSWLWPRNQAAVIPTEDVIVTPSKSNITDFLSWQVRSLIKLGLPGQTCTHSRFCSTIFG